MERPLALWRVKVGLEGGQPGESGGEQLGGELHAGGSSPSVLGRGGGAGAGVEGLDGMEKKEGRE